MFVFSPDPRNYAPAAQSSTAGVIPASDYKIGADFRSGVSSTDWFPNYASRTKDRGSRGNIAITNWFDGADNRGNPTTRPVYPDNFSASAHWWTGNGGGPAPNDPNGYARWAWGDTYSGGLCWIDDDIGSRSKHGIVAVASLRSGYVWYQSSTVNADALCYEIHVYDPADVAAVLSGALAPYKLQPKVAYDITSLLPGLPAVPGGGTGADNSHVAQCAFDSTTNRLYMQVTNIPNGTNASKMRVYVFRVN
jgi:hypothetical protein